jgi:HlyD family secretion protein
MARRDEARAALEALLRGTTAEELEQDESALAAAEAALAEAQLRLARLEVRAPVAGRVDALPFEIGERPPAGSVVAVLLAEGAPHARVHVPEPLRVRLAPGTPARVRVEGVDAVFTGRVRSVAHDAAFTPYFALSEQDRSRLSYVAEVELTDPRARELPSGVPAEVRFALDEVADGD